MLNSVQQLNYAIVLCDNLETMKVFYRDLFAFPVASESETALTFRAGNVLLGAAQAHPVLRRERCSSRVARRAACFSSIAGRSESMPRPTRCQRCKNP